MMIHVFCNRRGSGKTKALINLANEKVYDIKGNIVYIDDDNRPMFELHRKIRFIETKMFCLKDYNGFYGFLCGILSEDYDIEALFVDGLSNIVDGDIKDAALLFYNMEKLAQERDVEIYINLNAEVEAIPNFIKKYVA